MINIKKASEQTGVSADTIRYYERIGLIPPRMDLLVEQQRELQERIAVMQQAMDRLTFKIENYTSHMVPSENKLREFK